LAVAGDTSYDMLSGRRSGAGLVAGVLTGAHGRDALERHGATHVLASIAQLPDLLARTEAEAGAGAGARAGAGGDAGAGAGAGAPA
ncbi:haloacid dehalogenase, partial [Streptomyces sp. 12297]